MSKRGIYAPGTTNRIVSVKGSQVDDSIALELYFLNQRAVKSVLLFIGPINYHLENCSYIFLLQRAVKSAIYLVQAKVQEKQEERARSGRS